MKKTWVIPLVIMTILLVAPAFRWQHEAAKTIEPAVLKWEMDTWTQQRWLTAYTPVGVFRGPANFDIDTRDKIKTITGIATATWGILTATDIVWLILLLIPVIRKK